VIRLTLAAIILALAPLTQAQEIQLTHQVIAASPVEATAYSWTVLVDGVQRPQPSSDKKTVIVTLHDQQTVTLVLSVVVDGKLQTFVTDANAPGPAPPVPPVPVPNPSGVASLVIVTETANRTPDQQRLFVQIQTKYKTYPVLIVDQDATKGDLKAVIKAAQDLGVPAVVSLDAGGKVLATTSLPATTTYEQFQELIK